MKLRLLRAARGGYACPPQCRPLAVRAAQAHETSPTPLSLLDLHREGYSRSMTLTFGARTPPARSRSSPPGSLFVVLVRLA